jgi:hypothetical protein
MKKFVRALMVVTLISLAAAACAPTEKQVIDAANTVAAQITFVPVTYTPDVNVIVQQTFAAMTAQAGGQVAPSTPTPTPVTPGSISGTLSYPSSFIPPLRVVAFNVDGTLYRYVDTQQNQGAYQITGLAPGKYHVVAYVTGGGLAGGYTQMVPCGLSVNCTDHTLIDVQVNAGQDTPNINPGDWYADAGSFPPMPGQGLIQPTATLEGAPGLTGNGGLSGEIQYPAGGVPAMTIVAFLVGGGPQDYFYIQTTPNQSTYEMSLPPGQYYVVAYSSGPNSIAGGYTQAVLCGLTVDCTDHSLVAVSVASTVVLNSDVNLADWFAPAGTFPPNPVP